MTESRIAEIEQAIAELGAQWNNRLVHKKVGGNYEALAAYLKVRRGPAGAFKQEISLSLKRSQHRLSMAYCPW